MPKIMLAQSAKAYPYVGSGAISRSEKKNKNIYLITTTKDSSLSKLQFN